MTPRPNIRIFTQHLMAYNWRSSPLVKYGDSFHLSRRGLRVTTAKRLRPDARRNRDALLAKAREIFEAGDFDLRFDDFARLAGVGIGTLYRNFPTREALAEAVYRDEVATMCAHAR